MTLCELITSLYNSCDFCEWFCHWSSDTASTPCFTCKHERAYQFFVLACYMLETGGNPFI